jgi:hypothetical protein
MITEQMLRNCYGDTWTVEHCEDAHLRHIGGFLMTHGTQSCLTLSSDLNALDRQRGRTQLLELLEQTPIGTSRTILWHSQDP